MPIIKAAVLFAFSSYNKISKRLVGGIKYFIYKREKPIAV